MRIRSSFVLASTLAGTAFAAGCPNTMPEGSGVGPDAAVADPAPDATPATIPDGCSLTPTLLTYYQPATLPTTLNDTRCTLDAAGHCTALALKGYLYTPPSGHGPFPLLVDNHGSEQLPGEKCIEASYFAQRGFVVFVPHRRGHGKSTGVTLGDYESTYCSTPGQSGPCAMEYLHKEVNDVHAAITYAEALTDASGAKLVDPTKLALMGHSFGGIVTMFTNESNFGQRAVVNVAGASQSWDGNPSAVTDMTTAAQTAVAPVLYFEPMNDHSIHPTVDLPKIAGAHCRQFESALLPPIDTDGNGVINAADYADGGPRDTAHGVTMDHPELWGAMAYEFITRYLATPAATFDNLCQGTSYSE